MIINIDEQNIIEQFSDHIIKREAEIRDLFNINDIIDEMDDYQIISIAKQRDLFPKEESSSPLWGIPRTVENEIKIELFMKKIDDFTIEELHGR